MDIAKVFMTGRSQAVRLPKQFRFEGTEVRIRREGRSVILEPVDDDWDWLNDLKPMDDDMAEAVLTGRPGREEYARLKDDER